MKDNFAHHTTPEQIADHQKVFQRVLEHLQTQRRLAFDPRAEKCRYRLPNPTDTDAPSLKCFIGFLIPDNAYRPVLEKTPLDTILEDWHYRSVVKAMKLPHNVSRLFLRDLQIAHDASAHSRLNSDWRHALHTKLQDLIVKWELGDDAQAAMENVFATWKKEDETKKPQKQKKQNRT